MTVRVLHFDVFTSEPGKGNPAGIVLHADELEEANMQAVAKEAGFNDTAFISTSRKADFRIRYFSPRKEVDLCGHATIAAAIALHTQGLLRSNVVPCRFSLETKVGELPIVVDTNAAGEAMVFMSQAQARFKSFCGDRNLLVKALGLGIADLHPDLPIVYGFTGRWTLIVPIRDLDAMSRLHPQTATFPRVLVDMPGASIHPFCTETIGKDVDLHARHFSSPDSGTIEDPVTGTASGVLGAYYCEFANTHRGATKPLVIEQGCKIGQEGRVFVWAIKDGDTYAVRIAGTACFVGERLVS